jgi:hypothetical protein
MEEIEQKFIKDDLLYKLEDILESNSIIYNDISPSGDTLLTLELNINNNIIYIHTFEFFLKLGENIINNIEFSLYKDINNRPYKNHQFLQIEFDRLVFSNEFIINFICDSIINLKINE